MVRIFIGNLGAHYSEAVLRSMFEIYGNVEEVNLSRTHALVVMADPAAADHALRDLGSTFWFLRSAVITSPSAQKAA